MSALVATYLLTALTAGAGFAAIYFPLSLAIRWWLQGSHPLGGNAAVGQPEQGCPTLESKQAQQLVTRLHDVAMRLASDVGQHDAVMREVNEELQGIDPADGDKAIETVLDVVDQIVQANGRLTDRLTTAQETIRQQGELLESQMEDALTDPLTGIANRRAFDHEMGRQYADWQRRRTPVSLIMLDVDHFKRFNDQHGHRAGDEVLRGVARTLSETVREMDLVARYGGEEFSIILPDTELDSAKQAAERARQAVAITEFPFEEKTFRVTTSAGLAQLLPGNDTAALVERSDAALYASKKTGRNCSHYHNGTHCARVDEAATPAADTPAEPAEKEAPTPATPQPPAAAPTASPEPAPPTALDSDQSSTDSMTGLPTRADLMQTLRRRLAEKCRQDVPLSVIAFQLDDFDRLADLGARATGLVLDASARILEATSRKLDLVARSGTSRFAIMLPYSTLVDAVNPAERVRKAIASCDKLNHRGSVVRFTVSAGVAEAVGEDDENSLLERAESAMRQAAARGNDCIYLHNGETCEPALRSALV